MSASDRLSREGGRPLKQSVAMGSGCQGFGLEPPVYEQAGREYKLVAGSREGGRRTLASDMSSRSLRVSMAARSDWRLANRASGATSSPRSSARCCSSKERARAAVLGVLDISTKRDKLCARACMPSQRCHNKC